MFPYQPKLFIDGKFVDSVSGKKFAVINPSTGKKLCDVAEGDKVYTATFYYLHIFVCEAVLFVYWRRFVFDCKIKIFHVIITTQADVDIAVEAARRAFKFGSTWRTMDASNRGRLINKVTY